MKPIMLTMLLFLVTIILKLKLPYSLFKEEGYPHIEALFGIPPYSGRISHSVYYADSNLCDLNADTQKGDPIRPEWEDGGTAPGSSPYILMVDRGSCTFVQKVRNAQRSGVAAVIIADDVCLCSDGDQCSPANPLDPCQSSEPIMADDGSGSDILIPSFLMFKKDADRIKAQLQANNPIQMEVEWNHPTPNETVEYDRRTDPSHTVSQDFSKTSSHLRAPKPITDTDRKLLFWEKFDPKTVVYKTEGVKSKFTEEVTEIEKEPAVNENGSKRKFLNYTSSEWELLWLENIQDWETNQTICENILSSDQRPYLIEFEKTICSHTIDNLWCFVIDPLQSSSYMFNLQTGAYKAFNVTLHNDFKPAPPVVPQDNGIGEIPKVFSRMDFVDETTGKTFSEFIEPLVSHLRHPVAGCVKDLYWNLILSRAFIVPIPPSSASLFSKAYYFDAGASSWSEGTGGPSLDYFTRVFLRHEVDFDHIQAYEGTVSPDAFYASVPDHYKNRTHYYQEYILSAPSNNGTFLPTVISNMTEKDDYVFFKLDIDSGKIERGTVDFLLSSSDDRKHVTEFVWEHHVAGNYILAHAWNTTVEATTIYESYKLFLQLRQQGIRAHSYV